MAPHPEEFSRDTGGKDLSLGQFVLYRVGFIFIGSLAGAWADFGGRAAQLINLPHVIEMAITDHPGIAIAYDYRLRQMIRKLAHRRATNTDYFELPPTAQADIRSAAIRDFETQAETIRRDKERQKTANDKETEKGGKGTDRADRANAKAPPKGKQQWADGDWAAWKMKQNADTPTKASDETAKPDENTKNKK